MPAAPSAQTGPVGSAIGEGGASSDQPIGTHWLSMLSEEGHVRPVSEIEEELIRFALIHYRGRMSEVARRLGIGRSTLYRKLRDYGLESGNLSGDDSA